MYSNWFSSEQRAACMPPLRCPTSLRELARGSVPVREQNDEIKVDVERYLGIRGHHQNAGSSTGQRRIQCHGVSDGLSHGVPAFPLWPRVSRREPRCPSPSFLMRHCFPGVSNRCVHCVPGRTVFCAVLWRPP